MGISFMYINSQILGVQSVNIADDTVDFEDQINAIYGAIKLVSQERCKLGSYQNRLEHTINNLNTAAENLVAAGSRIREVNMALEMANFNRHQILQAAGTATLAQANLTPQSILKLLG